MLLYKESGILGIGSYYEMDCQWVLEDRSIASLVLKGIYSGNVSKQSKLCFPVQDVFVHPGPIPIMLRIESLINKDRRGEIYLIQLNRSIQFFL